MLPGKNEDLKHYHAPEDTVTAWLTDITAGIGLGVAVYLVTVLLLSL